MSSPNNGVFAINMTIDDVTNTTLDLAWTSSQPGKKYTITLTEVGAEKAHASKSVDSDVEKGLLEFKDLKPITQYTVSMKEEGPRSPLLLKVLTTPSIELPEIEAVHEGCADLTLTPLPEEEARNVEGYLLLVQPLEDAKNFPEAQITDEDLKAKLEDLVDKPYYLAYEFTHEQLSEEGGGEVRIGTGSEKRNGLYGVLQDPKLSSGGFYRAIFVAIMDRNSRRSVFAKQSFRMLVP